ncbi:acyl-CoA carboxylase subunit beta [Thermoactinomyces mirandus]|nr:carboxyl transferase domain-containing protein [Thermoactinomyces mirandus]
MEEQLQQLEKKLDKIWAGGGEKKITKRHQQGKKTARERITALLDPGSFNELDSFVAHRCTNFGMDKKETPGEGVVTGYGTIDSRPVAVFAQDFTVLGGSLGEMHAKKIAKLQDLALKVGMPIIGINDSGGARIQEGVDALSGYGQIFYRNTIASGVIPQIAAIMGPCAGGAVYSPALMDFIFMVQEKSEMFIAGPQVIKAVTGEEVSGEQLGGALTHNRTSGVAHFAASDEDECLQSIRTLIGYLPSNNMEDAPYQNTGDDPGRIEEGLLQILPDNPNKAFDMKEILNLVMDRGTIFEVQPLFAPNIITAFARLNGRAVGIIANQPAVLAGCLDIDSSDKAARFIRFCDAFNIPVVNFVDVPGFLPGTNQEYGGIIRHGAKMLHAYSEATVPKLTVIIRKAYGGAYLAMCSRDLGADQVFAWPGAEIAVMGPDGAANIIFRKEIKTSDNPQAAREEMIKEYRHLFANPYVAAERGYIDSVIDPRQTRLNLAKSLELLVSKKEILPAKKHGNISL